MKWLAPAAVVVVAVLAEVLLGRLAGAPDFALFLGRFHPLVVHLPIGFFLLVAMGEAATFIPKLRDRVEPVLGLLVPISTVAALAAFLMGQLLALEGGFPAGALGWHRNLTLSSIIGMALCWVLYDRQVGSSGRQGRWLYRGAMGAALGCLSIGAHFGGTMTRGESYLAKYAPGPLKPLLGAPEEKKDPPKGDQAPTAEPLVYRDVLQPVLERYCVECHGPEKQKGKLRVDSLEELMKGGEGGPAVVAGAPKKSSLLARLLLPESDDDHMPPEGKPGPKPEERALIEFWIERGAPATLKVRDALAPAVSRSLLEHALGAPAPSDSVPVSLGNPTPPNSAAAAAAPADAGTLPAVKAEPAAANPIATADTSATAKGSVTAGASTPGSAAAMTAPVTTPVAAFAAGATSGPGFLAAHCEKCHGAEKQKGKLRVDSVAALLKGGAGGAALVPGDPDKSSVVKRVRLALSDEEHMPPKKEPQPSAAEVAVLASWIRSGAGNVSARAPAVSAKSDSGATSSTSISTASAPPTARTPVDAPAPVTVEAPVADAPGPATIVAPATSPPTDVSGSTHPAPLKTLPSHVALFSEAIQPILREKCGKCHIKDKPAGGLAVEQRAQLLEGGFSGAGIVPKDRSASVLMQRLVLPPNSDEHMPPEGEPMLAADEVELIGAWIDQGAPANGVTETAKLTAGAARALSARGIQSAPTPIATRAGGCAACSVPGAPQSKWVGIQALALVGAAILMTARRLTRRL